MILLSFSKIKRFSFKDTRTFSRVFFFHFLVLLSFYTISRHRFVVFVFEKLLVFLGMELIRASVMVTLYGQYQLRLMKSITYSILNLLYEGFLTITWTLYSLFYCNSFLFFRKTRCLHVIFLLSIMLLLKKVWTFQLFPFPVTMLLLSVWFHYCRLNSWNINDINKNC